MVQKRISTTLICILICGISISSSYLYALAAPNSAAQTTSPQLSSADLQFGEMEIRKMHLSRPEMWKLTREHDAIWNWTARQFAGETTGSRIHWNPENLVDKSSEYLSDHAFPTADRPGEIRLRERDASGVPVPAETLWSSFAFECANISNGPHFNQIYELAIRGRMTKDEWIRANTELEFKAFKKAAIFYQNILLPLAKSRRIEIHPALWDVNVPDTYSAWIAQYNDHSKYPWSYWGKYYDETIVPYLQTQNNIKTYSLLRR